MIARAPTGSRGARTLAWVLGAVALTAGGAGTAPGSRDAPVMVAWDVHVMSAPWLGRFDGSGVLESVASSWTSPEATERAVRNGTFLALATGERVGRTTTLARETVAFPLGDSFRLNAPRRVEGLRPFTLDVVTRADDQRPGAYLLDLQFSLEGSDPAERTLAVAPHRGRTWALPLGGELVAVSVRGTPLSGVGTVMAPAAALVDEVAVDLVLVAAPWAQPGPALAEEDFVTDQAAFMDRNPERLVNLLTRTAAGRLGPARILATRQLRGRLGEALSLSLGDPAEPTVGVDRGLSGEEDGGGEGESHRFGVHVEAPERVGAAWPVRLSIRSSRLDHRGRVRFRRVEVVPGRGHAWLLPGHREMVALFIRVQPT